MDAWRVNDKIRRKPARHPSDARLRSISAGRHHVLTLAQLEAEGLSARAVQHRAAAGRLHRLYAGVYSVGAPTLLRRWMAAVHACGAPAVLSHRSAAALWGLIGSDGPRADVTVGTRGGRSRDGIAVHSAETLHPDDLTVHRAVPCTSVARTLLDYAAAATPRRLERAVSQADVLRLLDVGDVQRVLERNPRRHGAPALRDVLESYAEPVMTRSGLEEVLLAAFESARLPKPRVNAFVALDENTGYHPDFLWPDARLIVEVDGQRFHASRPRRRHDARRDRRLRLAGDETFRWVGEDPTELIGHVREFLASTRPPAAILED